MFSKRIVALLLSTYIYTSATEEWITVLVHGTVGFAANISLRTVLLAKKDCIEGSTYEQNVLRIREHPYLYTLQPMQGYGLLPVIKPTECTIAAHAFASLYEEVQKNVGVDEKNTFYTFGWTGLISERRRYAEARTLYYALKKLVDSYRAQKKRPPKIRLLAYSHGGALILNLADIRACEFPKDTFAIDEFIALGLPVHTEIMRQIYSPLFKKIYHVYSEQDRVQQLDIFSRYDFVSHRTFKMQDLDNLTQIEIKLVAPLRRLPQYCLPAPMRGIINQSPGHIELWFFGWTPSNYRKNLYWHPLPAGVLLPYVINAAKQVNKRHVTVHMRPKEGTTIVSSKCGTVSKRIPFLSQETFSNLIKKACECAPTCANFAKKFKELESSIDIKCYQ